VTGTRSEPARVALVLVFAACAWLVTHPFLGIFQDGRLYALQGLAQLHPDALGGDVFLRFASQDDYTLFSPLYAMFINWLGVENAARLMTAIGQVWWIVAAIVLARGLLPGRSWLYGAVLVCAVPIYYSAYRALLTGEGFLTPRLYAECLTLTAFSFLLRDRQKLAIGTQIVCFAIHPLMAMSGALVMAGWYLRDRATWVLTTLVGAGTLAAVAIARLTPISAFTVIDADWLTIIGKRTPIVTPDQWDSVYLASLLTTVTIMLLASRHATRPALKRLAMPAAVAVGLGICVSIVGSWLFPTVILAQGQGWRWAWFPMVLAVVALPDVLGGAWRADAATRAGILLAAAAILIGSPAAAYLAGAGLVLAGVAGSVPKRLARALYLLATAVCAVAAFGWMHSTFHMLGSSLDSDPVTSWSWRKIVSAWVEDGVGVAVLSVLVVRLALGSSAVLLPGAVVSACAALSIVFSAGSWTRSDYTNAAHASFQAWRDVIPVSAEVLWGKDPALVWILLERRNYVSADQTAGVVFSREATRLMQERARKAGAIVPPTIAFAGAFNATWKPTLPALRLGCRTAEDLDFVITNRRVPAPEAAAPVELETSRVQETLYLYDCASLRQLNPVS